MPKSKNGVDGWEGAFGKNKLSSLFENMLDGFTYNKMVFDSEGRPVDYVFLEVNEAFERLTGLKRECIIGKPVTEVIPGIEKDPADWIGVYGKVALTGAPVKFENYSEALNKWFVISVYSPEKGYFVASFEDISEHKKVEYTLRLSEQLLRSHVENSPLAVVEWDSDFIVTRWVGAAEKTFGWSASEVVGKRITDLNIIYEPDIPIVQATMVKLTDGVTRQVVSSNRNITKDGKILYCTWYNSVLLDEHGKMKSVLSRVLDNTEQKNAEAKMQQKNAILEGIKKIFEEALSNRTETALGEICLSAAEEITQSKFGFIGKINPKGLEDIVISNPGWEVCRVMDSKGHRRTHLNFAIHGIYGQVLKDGKALFTNDPQNHPDSIGTPKGHPPLKSFLGVPLIRDGVTIGLIAVGNREGGYTQNELESLEGLSFAIVEAFRRKRIEKTLFSSMAHLHLAHNAAKSGTWEWDLETNEKIWSEELWRLHGLKPYSVQPSYEAWRQTVHPNDLAFAEQAVQEAVRNGTDLNTEWRVCSDGKAERWLMARGRPICDANGKATRFIGIVMDITERKQVEQALNNAKREWERTFDSVPDLIAIIDRQHRIVRANKAMAQALGVTPEQAVGQICYECVHGTNQPPDSCPHSLTLNDGKAHVAEIHEDCLGGDFLVSTTPLMDEQGQMIGSVHMAREITKRRQMEKKLEEYTKHLEDLVAERTRQLKDSERLTAIGETAGMVGHDLRNPLQTISGEIYLAKTELEQLPSSPIRKNLEEVIQVITDQISYMDKIVSDLQDFVRPIEPEKAPVDLQKLLSGTLAGIAIPQNIKVQKRISSNMPEVSVDAQLFKRVFINLVTNSIQAMPNGGTMKVKAQKKQSPKGSEKILIIFEDTGVGMPEEIKSKIFKPLFTTKPRGQGFGLAVCKRVVEAHGGAITFESKEGKGTKFTIELPTSKPKTTQN